MQTLWNLLPLLIFGSVGGLFVLGFLRDTARWLWNPKRRYGPNAKKALGQKIAAQKAKEAIDELARWKAQRRLEDRQKWRNDFEALVPREPEPVAEPAKPEPLPVVPGAVRIMTADGRVVRDSRPPKAQVWPVKWGRYANMGYLCKSSEHGDLLIDDSDGEILESYSDGHYSTCPYECDCPKWARRPA